MRCCLEPGILRDTHTESLNRYSLYPVISTGDSFNQESNVECVRVPLASSIHPYSRNSLVAGYKGSGATFGFYQCMLTVKSLPAYRIEDLQKCSENRMYTLQTKGVMEDLRKIRSFLHYLRLYEKEFEY